MESGQRKEEETVDEVLACRTPADLCAADFDHAAWERAIPVRLENYWSGDDAPAGRQAEARLLWSDAALHVRFAYRQTEPFSVSSRPQTKRKAIGLWERDVCELFITPNTNEPEKYFEFEAAPTGEWLDLRVHQKPDERVTDWDFSSGMTTAARIADDIVTIGLRVPWRAFGHRPTAGERWRVNLFRCVGAGSARGYVAWRPTRTEVPNFHVPAAFGWVRFKG